jgi:DNA-binding beta-propeller fold protein YncE
MNIPDEVETRIGGKIQIMTRSALLKLGLAAALAASLGVIGPRLLRAADTRAPHYEVDVNWPKPLPNLWVMGGLGGVCVDKNDHVFALNRRDPPEADLNAGRQAPAILEFDSDGNLVKSWSDPENMAPRLHSCFADKDNNIWIAAAPSGVVQKYSHDGKLLQQIGKKGVLDSSDGTEKGTPLNSNAAQFHMPSGLFVDPVNGDVFVSDGEGSKSNKRVAVIDKNGNFLRQWKPEGMESVHCLLVAKDGNVYVCNRQNSRIQVYDKMGNFKKNIELPWTPVTPPASGKPKETGGAVVALAFSPDERLLYVLNQNNSRVDIVERETGKIITSFGRVGPFPGEFIQAHGIAADSKGNVYVAENRGRRVQKFKLVTSR